VTVVDIDGTVWTTAAAEPPAWWRVRRQPALHVALPGGLLLLILALVHWRTGRLGRS
jgi:hypothetical protein